MLAISVISGKPYVYIMQKSLEKPNLDHPSSVLYMLFKERRKGKRKTEISSAIKLLSWDGRLGGVNNRF